MTDKTFPERLYAAGWTDLVSVIPPGAQLMPSSKIAQSSVGKIPGRRHVSGLWHGYNWRADAPTLADVQQWGLDAANVGTRADRFPGVDIDCRDARLAQMIEDVALGQLGPAPVRYGQAPKRLLAYSTAEPFSRMRLMIYTPDGQNHLVEILGRGQQYLVHGMHPSGTAYRWQTDPLEFPLTEITREQADAFLAYLEELLDTLSVGRVERVGDGRKADAAPAADQQALHAPSIDLLREAVACIPNNDHLFPGRDEYVRMGYAIRAAAGDENENDGYEIFASWAGSHETDGRVAGNPETWRSDWRRFKGPFSVGWSWIAEMARGFGFADAALDFDALESEANPDTPEPGAPLHSEQWLAEQTVARHRSILRFVPQKGSWLVWDTARWKLDAELLAEDVIKRSLKDIALAVVRQGVTPKEIKDSLALANAICTSGKAAAVAQLVRSDRAIAVSMEALDHDPWMLSTPAGIVDLKTGTLGAPNPDALATKLTAVPPAFGGLCPEWLRFLAEATGGDAALEGYLQRLAGYYLTGSTREQQLSFIFGPGGNGKSVFLNAVSGILGDYARVASMDTFTAGYGEKHSTDLAMLMGARLVTASETAAGKRWDDQRIKSLTGGEQVTARFMRMDNFTYLPQFKLAFSGNHQPELRDVDKAMRRRVQMVPFTVTPKRVDPDLGAKLREEWPAILAWMIEGCLVWQKNGLRPPAGVLAATAEYFENEDAYGTWLKECVVRDDNERGALTQDLFQSWREWANRRKEHEGSMKRLSSAMIARGFARWQDPDTRRMGFAGIRIDDRQDGLMQL